MATDSQAHLVLQGNHHVPAMPLKPSEVNHLRRLLAWIRVEFYLDEHMQRGMLQGASGAVATGIDPARAREVLQGFADKINSAPEPVRAAVVSLSATLHAQDAPSKGAAAVALVSDFDQVQGLKDVLAWMAQGSLVRPATAREVARPIEVPAYIQSALKMLAKGIAGHETAAGIIDTKASAARGIT